MLPLWRARARSRIASVRLDSCPYQCSASLGSLVNAFPISLILLKGTELKTKVGNDHCMKFICLPLIQAPREQLKVATLTVYSREPLPRIVLPCVFECNRVYVAQVDKATTGVKNFMDSHLFLIASESRVRSKWQVTSLAHKSITHYVCNSPCFKTMLKSVFSKQ
jgi:hypothetical protein